MNSLLDPTAIEQVPLAGLDLPSSTYTLLERAAEQYGHQTAHVLLDQARDAETVTYEVLLRRVNQSANALHRLGVSRHDAVALLSPNNGEMIVGLLAAEAVGIAQPLNPSLAPEALASMLNLSGARVLIAAGPEIHPQLWGLAVRLGEQLGLDAVLALRPDGPHGAPAELGGGGRVAYLEDVAAAEPADHLVPPRPGPGDVAAYFHTGGTTGTPKLAAHSHENEVFTAWSLAATAGDTEIVLFGGLPLFHVNAVMLSILAPAFAGGRVVWSGPLGWRDPQLYPVFWKLVERFGITMISAVPTVYAQLAQVPVDADLSSLSFAVCGAAILPPAVRDAFEKHTSVPICEGYGLTEATCASARIVPGHFRPGSVGLRMPYQHIRAVDPADGTPLPPGRIGVITISGPSVFPGYVTLEPDGTRTLDTRGKVIDGWLDTGDLGSVDADGYVYLTGRLKDLIIRGGHNIDPAVVEDAVLSHPDVTGASAVGRPDPHAGEVPVAYVTVRPGSDVTGTDLVTWASEQVAEPAAAPKAVHIMDALPVTAIGKDYKPALRADAIRRVVAEELPGTEVAVTVEDGTPVARIDTAGERDAVHAVLDRYTFRWRFSEAVSSE
ncbi:acyl-CoA synthetase [Paractinoplanes hotanensis]|uniref:Acyl-CoA synthetase n=1 Tax=Paractinoplanes hotanensis TaxID=2906497 RepID=A0ABT0YE26_9ACTN|nr:acyl-CoA synthetase [Actinoplanes hotanensis]MCM4084312.1 acyl-CoA synthetase [Actinoplanes hotanensis]